jgi:hypothetical protein
VNMLDSTSGYPDATNRAVTKPKLYEEQIAFLVKAGTLDRIEEARGDMKQADFLRQAIDDAIYKARRAKHYKG